MPLPRRDKPRLKRTAARKAWKGLTNEELEGLETKITEKFVVSGLCPAIFMADVAVPIGFG
jgi:hypothetical protein